MPVDFSILDDEELATRCRDGVDAAERELLQRYMQIIYWLPQRQFGADEDTQGDFLVFAIEKLRDRHTLARFDPTVGAKFRTWFGVVTRNLYLDYLRAHKGDPNLVELDTESLPGELPPASPETERAEALLAEMSIKCRTLFKLLMANAFYLEPDELRWLAKTSNRSVVEISGLLAKVEADLREADAEIEERQQQLDRVFWWKRTYERQLLQIENELNRPDAERSEMLQKTHERLQQRRDQHQRLLDELAGAGGVATAPYRHLAEILNMKEGTLGSHLTRCRQAVAKHLYDEEKERSGGAMNPDGDA